MFRFQIPAKNCHGFMLIELIAVLMIMAVLSVFILTRSPDSSFHMAAESGTLRSHLRYIQNLAISDDSDSWQIEFISSNSYKLVDKNSGDMPFPGEASPLHSLPAGYTVDVSDDGGNMVGKISFNRWGAPESGTGYSLTLTDTLTGMSETIGITKDTGFVQ